MSAVRRGAVLLREAVLLEIACYRALARWILRRPAIPDGATPIGYAQLATPVMALWIFASACELPIVHLLVPWEWLRITLLAAGVWGVVWMLGVLAGYRVRPHLIDRHLLLIRNGPRTGVAVPLASVAEVRVTEHGLPGIRSVHVDGDLLLIGVSSRTNLLLELAAPTPLHTPRGKVTVTRVGMWVDDPREVAAKLRRRRPAPSP